MQSTNKRLLYIGSILLIVLLIVLFFTTRSSNKKTDLTGETFDPNSQTTISNPEGKEPDTFGSEFPDTTFIGFDKLITYGLGSGQLDLVRKALNDYNVSGGKKFSELSLTVNSVETSTDNGGGMSFKVVVDRKKTLDINLTYPNLDSISLKVIDSGKEVYSKEYIVNVGLDGQEEDDL